MVKKPGGNTGVESSGHRTENMREKYVYDASKFYSLVFMVNISIGVTFFMVDLKHGRYFLMCENLLHGS